MNKIILITTLVALMLVSVVSAASVSPVFVDGNPDCDDLGYDNEFKVDPPASGLFYDDQIEVKLDNQFNWTSTFGIDAVIAKGGPNANVYYYVPASMGDNDLISPTNPSNGKPYGLSHITFCWDDGGNQVPEFGLIAGIGIIAAAGLFIFLKRK